MYIRPQRIYRNKLTGKTSPLLYETISDKVTLKKGFTCGLRRGTWFDTPFAEIENVPPLDTVPAEVKNFTVEGDGLSVSKAIPMIFEAICNSIEGSWQPEKRHVAYHSSGWDSRIISSAIANLINKNGQDWLGAGLIFLANRWEAKEARQIIELQGYDTTTFVPYNADGMEDEHFASSLDFERFYRECNAPVPLPGNLWSYLPEWCISGIYDNLQGYTGLYANETWNHFIAGGPKRWLDRFCSQYYYNVLAVLPSKIKQMEYPLSDLEVLKIVARVGGTTGDKLREAVARYACSVANDVPHLMLDDRGHPISKRLQKYCEQEYQKSWYAKNIQRHWQCPQTSEFSSEWGKWGVASLCEQLVKDGVKIKT